MTSKRLAAALREVHDVFSRPGISQIPAEELDSVGEVVGCGESTTTKVSGDKDMT
jgi:hypothetical protein